MSAEDEETLLLRPCDDPDDDTTKPPTETPIPWPQFALVLFLLFAEHLTSQVINPFAPQLIRDVGVTHGDETKVGYYVGLMQSIFFATQAVAILYWNRLSDRIGRKPVVLCGLTGLALSMFCFGLARTFWALVLARSLAGTLNGNIGIIKSIIAELADATNIARAFAYQPLAWSAGATIGPLIGGMLAHPAERFPRLFGHTTFLKEYPYFLPCAVPAAFSTIAWIATYHFLKETNPTSFSIRAVLSRSKSPATALTAPTPPPLRAILTRPVLIAAGNYALLSLVDISYRSLQPVFLATPRVLGGPGLAPPAIGSALAAVGAANALFQARFFAPLHTALGRRTLYLLGISAALPIFALFPLMSALARAHGAGPAFYAALALQLALTPLLSACYGCVFLFITAAAPSRATLGATNGLAQTAVSLMRAAGPAAANALYAFSLAHGYLGGQLVYAVLLLCAGAALAAGLALPRAAWHRAE